MTSLMALRRGGLGDLLVALPAVRLLRMSLPEARITLVARPIFGRLFLDSGIVDAVADADDFRWAALAGADGLPKRLIADPAEIDLAAGWFHSPSAAVFERSAAGLWPGAGILTVSADPGTGRPLSVSFFEGTAAGLRNLGLPSAPFESCAFLPRPPGLTGVPALGRPYAVVHPGAGSRLKRWPGGRFRQAVGSLAASGLSGAVVLGEAESSLKVQWTAGVLPPGWLLLDRPAVPELAALLSGASLYLGNDSGVTHLAAVLGVPGAAVFREEFAGAWHPGGKIAQVSAADVRDISVEAVLSSLDLPAGQA